MTTLALSKSKKAVLFYPGDGSVYITSVAFLRMLLDQKAKGNMLILKELRGASDDGIGSIDLSKTKSSKSEGRNFDFSKM